jgi:hypothetical protein
MACGYSQVPGIDFTESYAPVINDVSIIQNLKAMIMDIEISFLHDDL